MVDTAIYGNFNWKKHIVNYQIWGILGYKYLSFRQTSCIIYPVLQFILLVNHFASIRLSKELLPTAHLFIP